MGSLDTVIDADQVQYLRDCMNRIRGLQALPAICRARIPPDPAAVLLEVLKSALRLDLAYARWRCPSDSMASEIVLASQEKLPLATAHAIGQGLEPWLSDGAPDGYSATIEALDGRAIPVTAAWLGFNRENGVVVVGARRAGFPTAVEKLLLQTAVNLAVIEFQHLEVAAERRRRTEIVRSSERLRAENKYLRREVDADQRCDEIIGQSAALERVRGLVEQFAWSDACVLIQGETGTGKEMIARAVHRLSDRSEQPFVKLNCATVPAGLLEAELFGYAQGAFGHFELANGGTLFLDEIGDIPLELQPRVLRVLEEQKLERVDGLHTLSSDIRLIAATSRDLAAMVARREFREDLFYRLNLFPIELPPLRERREDIPQLVEHFVERYARRNRKAITSIPSKTMEAMCRCDWHGNVREIASFIERSVLRSKGSVLEALLVELT